MEPQSVHKNDFQYAQSFLKRFNSLVYKGNPVSNIKIFDNYNVWIFFQNRIFFNDLKRFSKDRCIIESPIPSLRVKIQSLTLNLCGLMISFVAFVLATLSRKKLLVYSIDRNNSKIYSNDARMDIIYEYLRRYHIPFIECFHTTVEWSFLKRFLQRKRWAIYIKSIDFIFYTLCALGITKRELVNIENVNFSSFIEEEKDYAKRLLKNYLSSIDLVIFRVKLLKKILPLTKIKALFAIDNTRDYWEVVLACQLSGILTYAFQHGHFTKYHVGWLNDGTFQGKIVHPDRIYLWSEFWKEELIRLGTYFPRESMCIGGFKDIKNSTFSMSLQELITVLVPYEVDSNKKQMKEYIDKLLGCGIKIFFKLRTDLEEERQLEEYGINRRYHSNFLIIEDVNKQIDEIDVVAGTYSTLLYDMIAQEKPIMYLETSSDFGEGLVKNNLAESVSLDNVCEKVKVISKTDIEVLKKRKTKLFGETPKLLYDTLHELDNELQLSI